MKKIFFLLAIIIFSFQSFAQTQLNEGFEGTTFPPDYWTTVNVSGNFSWGRTSIYTLISSIGTASAYIYTDDSPTDSPVSENWLITPKLSIENINDSISFYLKTINSYCNNKTLNIKISTTNKDLTSFNDTAILILNDNNITEFWVRHAIDLSSYVGQEVYIAFQIIGNNDLTLMLDCIQGPNIVLPSCPNSIDLTSNNPTTTSIDLSWIDPLQNASSWNIQYMLANQTDWTNATTIVATTNPYTLSNLLNSSKYKVRVQANCGEEQSNWSTNPVNFSTVCTSIESLPYTMNFNNETTDDNYNFFCWTIPSNSSSVFVNFYNQLQINLVPSNSCDATIMTPSFAEDINLLRIKFWAYYNNEAISKVAIGIMSDLENLSTIEMVDTILLSNIYTEYEVAFNETELTGPNKYIVIKPFVYGFYDYSYVFIDSVTVDLIPDCAKPTDIKICNLTDSSFDFSFKSNASLWNVQYMLASETNWLNSTTVIATTNPYTITGLTENTSYKVRIQANCDNQQSDWSNPVNVTTTCIPLTIPTTIETFDTVPYYTCWKQANGFLPQDGTAILTLGNYNYWGSSSIEMYSGGGNNFHKNVYGTYNIWLISPSIDLGEDGYMSQIEMDVLLTNWDNNSIILTGSEDVFGIVISTDNGITWYAHNAILWTNKPDATRVYNNLYPMQHLTIPLKDANNQPYQGVVRIGIYAGSKIFYEDSDIRVDNFIVKNISPCSIATDFIINNAAATSADLSWTDLLENTSSWNIQYMLENDTNWADAMTIVTTTNYCSLFNLLPSSKYKVRIQANCGSQQSQWSNTFAFSTTCMVINIPWEQNFDVSTSLPVCHYIIRGANLIFNNLSNSSPNSLIFTYGTWLVTPAFAEEISLLRVKFWAIGNDMDFSGLLEVGIMSNPTDTTTFESVYLIQPNFNWTEYEVTFDQATLMGENRYIAFKQHVVADDGCWFIDDIEVSYLETICIPPTQLQIISTSNSATLSWSAGENETSWCVKLNDLDSVIVSSTAYQFTELIPNTTYTAYVRANCENNFSIWKEIQFTTNEEPPEVTANANVLQNSVELLGEVISFGGADPNNVEVGFIYTNDSLLSSNFEQVSVELNGNNFSTILTDLLPATKYYYLAFLSSDIENVNSEIGNFTTNNNFLNNLEKDNINITLYPNPAEKETKLIISGINGKLTLSLTDAYGREINNRTIFINDRIEERIDISALTKGVYYLLIKGDNINRTQKIIVK
ncbi:MAG: choice-of-anchor J domain-containing protein [Endomicrobium sp.]|jgi:hypothetical protein|nr:choice-of-anchor J domain-containing protein [Endomicrobium sp.]